MSSASGFSPLAWDSDFFGQRIARVIADDFGRDSADRIIRGARDASIDCLYLLVDAEDSERVVAAEGAGFQHVDIRITRERGISADSDAEELPEDIDLCSADDIPGLSAIARTSHRDSRFYHDPAFSRERCDDLYETWIQNACQGMADAVVVARREGRAIGYVTCEIPEPGLGNLGLVAVAADEGGRGYGGRMIEGALGWLARRDCSRVRVVTQARNARANGLYESRGFETVSVENSYHLWLGAGEDR